MAGGVMCDAAPKERCVFCGSEHHQFGGLHHLDVQGMIFKVAREQIIAERQALQDEAFEHLTTKDGPAPP